MQRGLAVAHPFDPRLECWPGAEDRAVDVAPAGPTGCEDVRENRRADLRAQGAGDPHRAVLDRFDASHDGGVGRPDEAGRLAETKLRPVIVAGSRRKGAVLEKPRRLDSQAEAWLEPAERIRGQDVDQSLVDVGRIIVAGPFLGPGQPLEPGGEVRRQRGLDRRPRLAGRRRVGRRRAIRGRLAPQGRGARSGGEKRGGDVLAVRSDGAGAGAGDAQSPLRRAGDLDRLAVDLPAASLHGGGQSAFALPGKGDDMGLSVICLGPEIGCLVERLPDVVSRIGHCFARASDPVREGLGASSGIATRKDVGRDSRWT